MCERHPCASITGLHDHTASFGHLLLLLGVGLCFESLDFLLLGESRFLSEVFELGNKHVSLLLLCSILEGPGFLVGFDREVIAPKALRRRSR